MADDFEEGPDPNDIRRHQKKMLTDEQYRKRYRRIDFYRPNDKQREFHNATEREVMLRAANQSGKTHAASAQLAMDALAYYPDDWYEGRKFIEPPKIERPFDFLGWAGCTTTTKVRDGVQLKLLGNIREEGGLGTGMIPLDQILGKAAMSRGIQDLVDSITLRRETGGSAVIQFKSYEASREAWQGSAVDEILIDEDISRTDSSIYGECLARLITTNGRIICSMTPLLGMSPLRKRFKQGLGPSMREILMTIWDCAVSKGGHIPDEDIPGIIASFPAHERETRAFGADLQGEGAVFTTPADQIRERLDPAAVPEWWPWMWGVDFRHSGSATSGHPFAAVLGAWDRDTDTIHIVHAIRMLGLAPVHVAAMKQHPFGEAPVAYPHDGGRGGSLIDGATIAQTYKRLGLSMRPTHATFSGGGFNFEAGLAEMEQRFASGRLKVADHLFEWYDEYANYFRDKGLVTKVDDDLMSATRVLCMDIRYAKVPERGPMGTAMFRRPAGSGPRFARGTMNHPDGPGDPWSGRSWDPHTGGR
jgi:phage terminase large subunit-like protein